jgi:glycosyltransferase involved in cell wall biosynthesis
MHVLFVHPNFPGQFGHIALHLVRDKGWKCTFATATSEGGGGSIARVVYKVGGGARPETHFCSRTFENAVWNCDGAYQALKRRPEIKPDLIVGHSGFGTTLFLKELYPGVPVVNLFEYYYHPHGPMSDMDFRQDLGWKTPEQKYLRARCRNAMILLDLQNCDVGYSPTEFQKSRFPEEYARKIRVIFDGVDRRIYHGHEEKLRTRTGGRRKIAGVELDDSTRVVTYVSRGFETMRGFDIFMRAAKRIAQEYPDVKFIVAGADRISYGGDMDHLQGHKSVKEWVLSSDKYDLSKFAFVGLLNQQQLATLLASSDLHIYLTVPFVLSWSMMDAMSCGAVVLASATEPVMEMIRDGENGMLADFFNPEDFAQKALRVLKDPAAFRSLGRAAEETISNRYSLEAVMPEMLKMYEDAARRRGNPSPGP